MDPDTLAWPTWVMPANRSAPSRFTTEFDTPSPGLAVLTQRLARLLAGDAMFVDALLRANGYSSIEPDTDERAFYFRELRSPS